MKYFLFSMFAFSALTTAAQKSDNKFTINGSFTAVKSGLIYLTVYGDTAVKKDSVNIVNGKFSFNGITPKASTATLSYKKVPGSTGSNVFVFYVEPAKMTVTGEGDSLKYIDLAGSKINDDSKILKDMMTSVDEWSKHHYEVYDEAEKNKDQAMMDSLDDAETAITTAKRKVVTDFVKKYPNSMRGAMAIEQNFSYYTEASELEPVYNMLDRSIKESETGKGIKKMLDVYKTVAVGMPAPDIKQADTSGKEISLSSLKGKYVLVDFWASWCGPCRKENPNVVKAYNKYKNRDFEIFGVSYDTKRDRWAAAIVKDGLTWLHASDLQGWKNATSPTYYIRAIPSNVLIDKDGKIIARNLIGKKLYAKLDELLN